MGVPFLVINEDGDKFTEHQKVILHFYNSIYNRKIM